MSLQRNEILEVGNHVALYTAYDFKGRVETYLGIVVNKKRTYQGTRTYDIIMEGKDDKRTYPWTITNVVSFGTLEKIDDACVFEHKFNNNTQPSSKYRNLTQEEIDDILDGADNRIPF